MLRIASILVVCLWAANHSDAASSCSETEVASFQLCQDFRDIRNLIDPNTLVYWISYGYYKDDNFQTAMKYIDSDSFQSISDQIAESAPYKALLRRFSDVGVDTSTLESISNIFKCLMLKKPEYTDEDINLDNLEMQGISMARSLTDIATNLKAVIPKHKLRSLIRDKLDEDGDFAKFYRVARSTSFRNAAKKMFKSSQLKYSLRTLTRNKVDLKKLADFAAEILGWGPRY
ncbi:protein G12 [Eurosta solidaginis]|uniref:protein G12 n=1 Tax=Eurosta solidaginis TaxID=178769 RepID=UPI003530BC2A